VIIPTWTTSRKNVPCARRRIVKSLSAGKRGGAIVGGTAPCVCGHAPEEHGRDARYPGSTACVECECVAYEADVSEDE
jgi:hypothetical protein